MTLKKIKIICLVIMMMSCNDKHTFDEFYFAYDLYPDLRTGKIYNFSLDTLTILDINNNEIIKYDVIVQYSQSSGQLKGTT